MPLLKQDIRSPSRTGKTTMLLALAAGYSAQGIKGVIVTRAQQAVGEFKKRNVSPFEVWGPNELAVYLRRLGSASPRYQVFLLEDADLMCSTEGHPAHLLEHRFRDVSDHIVVMSFYTDEQPKTPILMTGENPTGWKLELLTVVDRKQNHSDLITSEFLDPN